MSSVSNSPKRIRLVGFIFTLVFSFISQQIMAEDPQLEFTLVSVKGGIVDIANAGDGSHRLFLVEQSGRIFIIKGGETLDEPFLDLRDSVSTGGERGLLSLAFAPDYKTSGFFYVWRTRPGGDTVLSRFKVSADADIADKSSEEQVLYVSQPYANHNGGRLQFGPDGMLYLGIGDGGASNDPENRSQDGSTLLGKMIRIDVDPSHGTYAIPPDNPFVGNGGFMGEIWALGLRNPWKSSFDSLTGDLYIADVGQDALEEVNFQPADSGGGENYGWNIMEGSECVLGGCDQGGLTLPVADYSHEEGCSITGGEVYRGSSYPNMYGKYFFTDFCTGLIWSLHRDGNNWVKTLLLDTSYSIATFGVGEDNSIYMAQRTGGIYLISDGEVIPEGLEMNAGFNDAWYNPDTDGQGFFVTIFPDLGLASVAWFTYDTELPPDDATANLGDPGHRWITGAGPFVDAKAVMDITITSGGIFDSATEVSRTDPPGSDGTMTLKFDSCASGSVEYDIPSINMSGVVPIQRVADDNIALCEAILNQ